MLIGIKDEKYPKVLLMSKSVLQIYFNQTGKVVIFQKLQVRGNGLTDL